MHARVSWKCSGERSYRHDDYSFRRGGLFFWMLRSRNFLPVARIRVRVLVRYSPGASLSGVRGDYGRK